MKKAKAATATEELPFRTIYAQLKARKEKLYNRKPRRQVTEAQRFRINGAALSTSEATQWRQRTAAERGEAKPKGNQRATPLTAKATRIERKGRPPVLEESDGQEALAARNRAEIKATLAPIQAARWGKE